MFQFRRLPPYRYTLRILRYSDWAYPAGFPHSEIHGSTSAFDSPWLIADCCVLRRLLVPRHSPCALCSLTIFESLVLLVKKHSTIISIVVVTLKSILPSCCFTILLHCSVFKVHPGCLRIHFEVPVLSPNSEFRIPNSELRTKTWWAQVDSNHRPHAYQACALTT